MDIQLTNQGYQACGQSWPAGHSRRDFLIGSPGSLLGGGLFAALGPEATAAPAIGAEPTPDAETRFYRIGTGEVDITPEKPMKMIGFASRTEKSTGAYQPLQVKALTIDDGTNKTIFLQGDLLFWDHAAGPNVPEQREPMGIISGIRMGLANRHGIAPEQIVFVATHTHCGPTLDDPEYSQGVLVERTIALVEHCLAESREGQLYFARGRSEIGVSRRGHDANGQCTWEINPYGPVDHEVVLLKAVGRDGKAFAVAVNYACHPTTVGGLRFGGDYIGFALARLEEQLGIPALFLQGCCGDVKPDKPAENNRFQFSRDHSLEHPARFGHQLAADVLAILAQPMEPVSGPIRAQLETVDLPVLNDWPGPKESVPGWLTRNGVGETEWPGHLQGPERRWLRLAEMMRQSVNPDGSYKQTQPSEVLVMRIGHNFVHVGLAGEQCCPIGLRLKDQLRGRQVIVTGYTGPTMGYFTGAAQVVEGGYEVFRNVHQIPYSPEAEDVLLASVMNMVAALA